jgi:hypothetical protein
MSTSATDLQSSKPQSPPKSDALDIIGAENESEVLEDLVHDGDEDSSYGSEEMSAFSASITSSIRSHIQENGLRYHAFKHDSTFYPFPNNENEQNRDDMKHAMTVMLCGGRLHYAPLRDDPQSILDLGTFNLESGRSHGRKQTFIHRHGNWYLGN